jgi:hypothetical protein
MTSRTTRRTAALAAVLAALAAPAAASAQDQPLPDADQVTQQQLEMQRTGVYPAPPALGSLPRTTGLGDAVMGRRVKSKVKGKHVRRIRIPAGLPAAGKPHARAALFGSNGDFDGKKLTIMRYIAYYYSYMVPRAGGRYVAPSMYEITGPTGHLPSCAGPLNNGQFCWNSNTMGWNRAWSLGQWAVGDNAWATPMAHEFGHGAQNWLGFGFRGQFQYELYREGFADCMAGAWYQWMVASRYADNVGIGDGAEFQSFFRNWSDRTTAADHSGHGDYSFRYGAAIYGYNTGFAGCQRWGGSIAAGGAA